MTRVKSCITALRCSLETFEPSARPSCDCLVELTLIEPPFRLLEDEVGMPSGKFARRPCRIVGNPFRLAAGRIVHESHDSVGCDYVGFGTDHGRVGFELSGDVSLGMIRI